MKSLLAVVALGLLPLLADAAKPYVEEVLTLQQARDLIAGCERYAAEHELAALSMAVYDASGNLKLFARQDGATRATVEFAHIKGRTAAVTALATSELAKVEFADAARPLGVRDAGGLTIVQGGVPVQSASGQHLGGFGVSGAPAAQDEACGLAGVTEMLAPNS
ncbi:MAG: heme-binding protein [Haliea sp.]|uniref:GlcG/HbpS family heme-binding protein n=1 Tax=Haliea sp. TaxID=1932666 RepID=UPI0032EECFE9